jgi:hypothetical protein
MIPMKIDIGSDLWTAGLLTVTETKDPERKGHILAGLARTFLTVDSEFDVAEFALTAVPVDDPATEKFLREGYEAGKKAILAMNKESN